MKLMYSTIKDEDKFILTDFTCQPSLDLLRNPGLFKILWCRSEEYLLYVDGYRIQLYENEVIFCTPLNIIEIDKMVEGVVAFVFNKEFFCIQTHDSEVSCNGFLFFGSAQPQVVNLREDEIIQFESILTTFQGDFAVKDHLQGEMLRSMLKRLLILSTRMVKKELPEPEISPTQMDIIRQFNILVEQHFRLHHQVKDYADMLFKSPKTLSNLFKKYGEKSPINVIHERIILEAKRLLIYSDKSSEEIAYDLGYKDAGHFSKFFKKHEGVSPSNFKKQKKTVQRI